MKRALIQTYFPDTMGSTSADGCSASCSTTLVALTNVLGASLDFTYRSAPLFRLRSKRGKLLLDTSSRNTCPFLNTLLVAHMSIENLYTCPGFNNSGFSRESRYRMRIMPSVRFCAKPLGQTSTSFAVKSVSTADDFAYNSSDTGPVASTSSDIGGVE